jgi:prevent-host-death family protein
MDEISIEKARPRLGDLVNDAQNGTATCITRNGKPAAMLMPLTRLTDHDRRLVARALELAGTPPDGNRAFTGNDDHDHAAFEALGHAKHLLGELAAIITRLDGHAAAQTTETGHG